MPDVIPETAKESLVISWDRVRELQAEVGEDDFAEIVSLFLSETEDALGQLSATYSPEEAEAVLHGLKGSALNLGFQSMAALCNNDRSQGETLRHWPQRVASIHAAYKDSRRQLLAGC